MVRPLLSQYYYYAYNPHTLQTGFLPLALLPPYPFPLNQNWSLHAEDSEPIISKNNSKLANALSPRTQDRFLGSTEQKGARKQQMEGEDGSDAFTEKRNIIPNNINHILAYVQRKSKSERVVTRTISRLQSQGGVSGSNLSARRFYAYQTYLKGKIDIHVSKKTLLLVAGNLDLHSEIFSAEEQLFYNRVCRAAISHYLRNVAVLTTLNSRRLRETSKKDHLRAQRHLLHFINHLQNEQILQA